MSNVTTIRVWKERKRRKDRRFTEEDAERLRGYIAWKIMNKRGMDERDGLLPPAPTPRPWPPSVSKPEQTEQGASLLKGSRRPSASAQTENS